MSFDPTKEGNSISAAINHVLEQQHIEWIKKGVDINLTYTACLIGLSQAIYDEIANFALIKLSKSEGFDVQQYKDYYENNTCLEAEAARKAIIKYGKEVLINEGTFDV